MRTVPALCLLLVGCSDYTIDNKPDVEAPATDSADPPTEPEPTDTTEPVDTAPITEPPTEDTGPTATTTPEPTCAETVFAPWDWYAGAPFTEAADPVDGAGLPFHDPAFDRAGLVPVTLPDTAIPVGHDRFYVASFDLVDLPPDLSLNLQSDDGITVWLNGVELGRWGGDWQVEGCVNENANCLVTTTVPPVEVTGLLAVGTNHVAARVSNPVANAWFEIIPECIERP